MMSQFSTQLRAMLVTKNLSQDALAEQLFISSQSISKWRCYTGSGKFGEVGRSSGR
ncbi:hypothetical protein [Streptococcus acidominimus]|uniref:hypothetical protein n=1 Tax=Streptococcus acidominimus TaxID=1326 RepID=UPI003908B329